MSVRSLSLAELATFLRAIQYRPNWAFEVYETATQGLWLAITAGVEDSFNPGSWTTLRIKSPLPPFDTYEEFLRWLRWRLERIEVHECHEWLRWEDGKAVFDPHADGADEPR